MISAIAVIIFLISLVIGRLLFSRLFNHISLYSFVWFIIVFLFDQRLIRYNPISISTWLIIILAYLSFLLGVLTAYTAAKMNNEEKIFLINNEDYFNSCWFRDDAKLLMKLVVVLGIIGILVAVQNWYVLLKKFGNVQTVLLNASLVYKMRVQRTIEGQIPYLFTLSYVAVFFAAVYSAFKNKITLVTIIPFLGVILKEMSQSARAGILNAVLLFISTFLIFRFFKSEKKRQKLSNKNLMLGTIILVALVIVSVTLVKITRVTNEKIKGASTQLNKLETNAFVSPTIYLYFSGHIGTLDKVLKAEERSKLPAEKTLTMFYSTIAKFDLVKRPKDHDKGYFIPVWINTGTFLREIYSDYGIIGTLLVPYLLGLLTTIYWFRFMRTGNFIDLVILAHLYVVIGFSFVIFSVRLATWVFPIILLPIIIKFIESRCPKYVK
uniref:Oligosaccharide repeat unit polymerase n=2 Tax=Ignavibacterium album TaxID=591197 RepID=A0A7V2ZLF9_9BACT